MPSNYLKIALAIGLFAALATNVAANRMGIHAPAPAYVAPPALPPGPHLIPPPPGIR
jgi:hypothetical protein